MNALEALTRLIYHADGTLRLNSTYTTDKQELSHEEELLFRAATVGQVMLNTALPIARYRVHVEIEDKGEFTLSCPSAVVAARVMSGIREEYERGNPEIEATLWEQRKTGADMLHGYRGPIRAEGFRGWIRQVYNMKDVAPNEPQIPTGEDEVHPAIARAAQAQIAPPSGSEEDGIEGGGAS